jgi:hypothetical protein
MKVISIQHPDSTYPDLVEAICMKLGKDYRLHSNCFLPSPVQGIGTLMLFFEPKAKFKVVPFKAPDNEK